MNEFQHSKTTNIHTIVLSEISTNMGGYFWGDCNKKTVAENITYSAVIDLK